MPVPSTALQPDSAGMTVSRLKNWSAKASAVMQSAVWRRRAARVLGGLQVFWALTYALVPMLAKSQIEKITSSKLGRVVSAGSVDFKPWSLEVAVNGLKIAKLDGVSPQLSIQRL